MVGRVPSSSRFDLIIIGAPRSGTNILRDVICRLPGCSTWPCDEINYVWRHGNARWPSDALPPERADGRAASHIRRAFARRRRTDACDIVVEKTCANSLRVPFVDRVLPDARYVFIHRDPVDAVASAMLRWNAKLDLSYTLAKARFVPISDLPYYGMRFLWNRLHRRLSEQRRLASWGPRLEGMDEILRSYALPQVCACQWRECVTRSVEALAVLSHQRVHVVRYEDFVISPATGLAAISEFLGMRTERAALVPVVAEITDRSVGKGFQALSESERRAVESIVEPASGILRQYLDGRDA